MPPAAPEDPYRVVRGFGFGTLALSFLCAAVGLALQAAEAYVDLARYGQKTASEAYGASLAPSRLLDLAFTFEGLRLLFGAMGVLALLLGGAASRQERAGRRALVGAGLFLATLVAFGPGIHLLPDALRGSVWELARALSLMFTGAALVYAVSPSASRVPLLAIAAGTLALLANELLWRTTLAAGAPAPGSLAWSVSPPLLRALGFALLAGALAAHVADRATSRRGAGPAGAPA